MPTYYVVDTTVKTNGKNPVRLFTTTLGVVKHLEQMCRRQFKMSRATYMNESESIGHGADEPTGRAFCEQMEQYFNIGVIRDGKQPVRTNIFQADTFSKGKNEHGN